MNLKLNDLRKKAGYRSSEVCEKLGITQSEVCEKLGITQMVLRNAEYRGIPIKLKKDMIPKLAEIYSVSELDVRRADNNTRNKNSPANSESCDSNNADDNLVEIDLREVFSKLDGFEHSFNLKHLRELLNRVHEVEERVDINYKGTLQIVLDESTNGN